MDVSISLYTPRSEEFVQWLKEHGHTAVLNDSLSCYINGQPLHILKQEQWTSICQLFSKFAKENK